MRQAAMLLAHEGGWDEGLLVAGPMLAIVGLLYLAKRRADLMARQRLDQREARPVEAEADKPSPQR